MKKNDKRETINLFFSAFLVTAFIICAHFFTQFTATLDPTVGSIVSILLYVVFGLLLFYATRVGDGKAVKRFSVATLVVLVIPSLYIIIAAIAPGLPLNDVFAAQDGGLNVIVTLACVALGYGVPYTFLSGYEIADDSVAVTETEKVVEGGIEADLAETEVLEGGIEADLAEAEESDEEESVEESEEDAVTDESVEG
ncbi:MAG: hypothetical protein U0L76_01785 [Ruminococcus sp.]|nr:hypothetical protein [Ruminococcus sp.]